MVATDERILIAARLLGRRADQLSMGDGRFQQSATVAQGFFDNAFRWTGYPLVRPRSKQTIHFSRHYLPGCGLVPANECQVPRQRGNQKGRRIPQTAWGRIEALGHAPTDWSVPDNEVLALRRSQREPAQAREPPDLKVVGLNVNAFQEIRLFAGVGNPPFVKELVRGLT